MDFLVSSKATLPAVWETRDYSCSVITTSTSSRSFTGMPMAVVDFIIQNTSLDRSPYAFSPKTYRFMALTYDAIYVRESYKRSVVPSN